MKGTADGGPRRLWGQQGFRRSRTSSISQGSSMPCNPAGAPRKKCKPVLLLAWRRCLFAHVASEHTLAQVDGLAYCSRHDNLPRYSILHEQVLHFVLHWGLLEGR